VSEPTDPAVLPRVLRRSVAVLVVAAFVLWWQWPWVAGHDERLDVLSASDTLLASSERAMATYVRDLGMSFAAMPPEVRSCDDARVRAEVERRDPVAVVLAATGSGCDLRPLVESLRSAGRTVVVLVEPGVDPANAPGAARVVDAGAIVGVTRVRTERPCEWWDQSIDRPCADGGIAVVRDDRGAVTDRGIDRIGRAVAARLG
jgi:hypothetical protein